MPPWEPLTTTAPAASLPMRVILSAVRTGASSSADKDLSRRPPLPSCREIRDKNKPEHPAGCGCRRYLRHAGESVTTLMLFARHPRALGRLLPVVFALLLAPDGTLLGIEFAVVIGVDLVEALTI